MISLLFSDRSFDDDDSVDGSRPSSAQAPFKVPKVPKKPGDSASSSRRPSATGAAKTGETSVRLLLHILGCRTVQSVALMLFFYALYLDQINTCCAFKKSQILK